jgi:hypothetical protein
MVCVCVFVCVKRPQKIRKRAKLGIYDTLEHLFINDFLIFPKLAP